MAEYYYYSYDANGNLVKKKKQEEEIAPSSGWLQKGALSEGVTSQNVNKAILGTLGDVGTDLLTSVIGIGEKMLDTGAGAAAIVGEVFGHDKFANDMDTFAKKDLYNEEAIAKLLLSDLTPTGAAGSSFVGGTDLATSKNAKMYQQTQDAKEFLYDTMEQDSVLAEKADALVQSIGQQLVTRNLKSAGIPWELTTALISFGSEYENALNSGANRMQAGASAAISSAAEIITEKMFDGGIVGAKGVLRNTPKDAVDALGKGIAVNLWNATKGYAKDMGEEALEEVFSEAISKFGQALYKVNTVEEFGNLIAGKEAWQDYLDAAIGGAVMGGIASGKKAATSAVTGKDYETGLTQNEQKVFKAEYDSRIEEAKKDGELDKKAKQEIYDAVLEDIRKGNIDTDTIEKVLGGEAYSKYEATVKEEESLPERQKTLQDELEALRMKDMTAEESEQAKANEAELLEIEKKLAAPASKEMRKALSDSVFQMVEKDSNLRASYYERGKRSQKFEADLDQYNAKQREVVKKAVESGILNNTRKTHELVDFVAKASDRIGTSFNWTNNQKLAESGYALEGKAVNGFVNQDGITLNINSGKALHTVVGHEITHVLEGTELYGKLSDAVIRYAKTKGDHDARLAEIKKLYEGVENAKVDRELVADLVGDYLFTDSKFLDSLVQDQNLFQRLWNEVRYLYNIATAGSDEAKQLLKVKRAFERAWNNGKGNGANGDIRFALKMTEASVKSALADAMDHGDAHHDNVILLGDIPGYISNISGVEGDLYIYRNHAYENMVSEEKAAQDGRLAATAKKRKKQHFHNLGDELMTQAILSLDNPLITIADKGEDGNPGISLVLPVFDGNDNPIHAFVSFYADEPINGVHKKRPHIAVTFYGHPYEFEAGDGRKTIVEFVQEAVDSNNVLDFDRKKLRADLPVIAKNSTLGNVAETTLKKRVAQFQKDVKKFKADNKINYSISASDTKPTANADVRLSLETASYAEITEEQQKLHQRQNDLRERKREAQNNPELNRAMDEYSNLFSEMRSLLPKKRTGTATTAELDRLEEIKTLRDDYMNRITELQESLGLNAMAEEERELREMSEELRVAADNAWAREGAEKENKAIEKSGLSAPEYFRKKALKAFKTTANFNEAGYMLPDGKMLNFSGGERNHRSRDHREIGEIYEATQSTAALNRFLKDGNIRIMAESPGIDIPAGVEPTKEQYAMLKKFINTNGSVEGQFFVDISDADGRSVGKYGYNGKVNADRVINDIKYYYATGEVRQQSGLNDFLSLSADTDIAPVRGLTYGRDIALEEIAPPIEDIAPVREDIAPVKATTPKKIATANDRTTAQLNAAYTELASVNNLREASLADFDEEIANLQAEYDSKKNKNTNVANELLRRIERTKARRDSVDAAYQKSISDVEARISKLSSSTYKTAMQRKAKQEEYTTLAENLAGDTSTWVDKKLGIQYQVNTLKRNLRDVVRTADGKRDIAKADAIYDELQGKYNHNEALLNRRANDIKGQFAKLKITDAENVYIQMLGELRHNPETTLSKEVVDEFYNQNKAAIDEAKVDKAIDMAREMYDQLFADVNAVLKEQGMKEIPYRKGYFPHFVDEKQGFLGKLLNWKKQNNNIPTDIAGLTETFTPSRSWQSFNKQRTSDVTDYNFLKGMDGYVRGSLDWIYHIEDIQKRRAFENYIRYVHSDAGVKEKIDKIRNSDEYDANEAQELIDGVYAEANNPLGNFVTDLRAATNKLAGKKMSMDRGMEAAMNRDIYSTMSQISNRVSANMVGGSISSALTNFIPITQSWGEVSPVSSLRAMRDTIRAYYVDDGVVDKSDFLTNRLNPNENLYKTKWDKVSDAVGSLMGIVDGFTSQTVWRSKYMENISNGMSENAAIKNADEYAAGLMADRSRGNMPTLFEAKNPVAKMVTAFQLEVANQYAYMLKDMPQNMKNETTGKLVKGYLAMFVGAYAYNALYSTLVGRNAAFDPIKILSELLTDIFDEEEEPSDVAMNFVENVLEETPFVGGILGGGRIPIASALPYDGSLIDTIEGIGKLLEGDLSDVTTEWLNPVYYMLLPTGGGQLRKTNQGLKMFFDDDLPIAGSYTKSGNLRFTVDETPANVLQAALFGQYASKNARDYFDNARSPLSEKQIEELKEVDIPIADYWKYRDGLKGLDTLSEKADYIASLDLPIAKKNILVNNQTDRNDPIDLTDYSLYKDFEEFDWASKNPSKYTLSKAIADDVTEYKEYTSALNDIKADKDANGKSISGTAKAKKLEYINSLDIEYGKKMILYKSLYPSDNTYDSQILEYLGGRDDLSVEELITILEELGFKVNN